MRGAFEAHRSLTDPETRRQSILLGRSLAVLTALFACVDTALVLSTPDWTPPWPGYAILITTFALNRAGYFKVAGPIATSHFSIVALGMVFTGADVGAPVSPLVYLPIGPLLGTLFLPIRGVVALTVLNLSGIAAAYFVVPGLRANPATLIGPSSTTAMFGALAAFYMHHRNRVEADRTSLLERSEERLRLALGAAQLGIWELAHPGDRITLDAQAQAILGTVETRGDLVAAIAPAQRDELAQVLGAALSGAAPAFSLTATLASGTDRQLEITGHAVGSGSAGGQRLIGTLLDVSARKRLEAQLRQAQKMEALGGLAGGIAHDFNNVLMVILGNIGLLQRRHPDAPELPRIEAAATSAATLTRQLLAFGRSAVLAPSVLDLADIVRGTTAMVARLIGEDIAVSVHAPTAPWPARLDRALIEQVLFNLATNARDAMPNGGSLEFEVSNQSLALDDPRLKPGRAAGDYLRLSATDSGEGMDEVTRARVFEPFFTTKARGKGTGLGLSMVFGTVTQSGGFIEISSEPGRGARFDLYFPRCQAAVAEVRQGAAERPLVGNETLLLVEDDESVRGVIELVLREAGYRVLTADSPLHARTLFPHHASEIALVITDEVMPGGRGSDLVAELRRDRPALRALSISGYAEPHADMPASVRDLPRLQKPFALDDLLRHVRNLLDAPA